jgi:hypothetical protein
LKIVFAPFSNYVGEFETLRDSSNHFQEKWDILNRCVLPEY